MTTDEEKKKMLDDPMSLANAFRFFHEANEVYWERRYKALEDRIKNLEVILTTHLREEEEAPSKSGHWEGAESGHWVDD